MLPGFAEIAVTVIDPGWRTVNGSKVADFTNPIRTKVYEYCWSTPGATTEDLAGRQADTAGYYVLFPEDAVVPHTSKVILDDGLEYQVVGRPKNVRSISGNLDHISAFVKRWAG